MWSSVTQNLQVLGPLFAGIWIVTIFCAVVWPQRYRNSFLLMASLLVTMLFIAGFLGFENGSWFLLICFLIIMLALFLVPVLLIINGIQMIRRESFSFAHILSLLLGIVIGIGEAGAVSYVFGLSGSVSIRDFDLWVLLLTATVFYFSFLLLCFVFYSVFIQIMPHRMNFNYVIIHGCGLIGGDRMSRLLSNRADKAIEIYQKCRNKPFIIPSGGQGGDETISEAQAMKNYLIGHGIPETQILPEDRSLTTRENLVNSKAIIDARDGEKKTALVSSNYHVYRCLLMAREAGLRCTGIGARVAMYYWPSALIREFIAVFLTKHFLVRALIGWLLFVSPILLSLIHG